MSRKQFTTKYFWSTCAATKLAAAADLHNFAGHRKIKIQGFDRMTLIFTGNSPMYM
jgi:hypothetical protein